MVEPHIVTMLWAGLAIGLAFGVCGQLTGFCLTSGMRGFLVENDGRKLRAFALAAAIALVASQGLDAAGLLSLERALYRQGAFPVPLVLAGGLLFGYGMILANGCGARALVLLGQGNLRSFVVLAAIGIAGYATLTGLVAPLRLMLAEPLTLSMPAGVRSLPALVGLLGLGGELARWLVVALLAGALAVFALSSPAFRTDRKALPSGVVIGLLIAAGWYATGVLGADDFDPQPLASLTFIAPIGETIQYVMIATGVPLSFAVVTVAGIFLGALASALVTRQARIEGFSRPRAMLRYLTGGAAMGIGGALALGCSIGQGLTGLSTLALTSFVAVTGIVLGAAAGLKGPLRLPPPQP